MSVAPADAGSMVYLAGLNTSPVPGRRRSRFVSATGGRLVIDAVAPADQPGATDQRSDEQSFHLNLAAVRDLAGQIADHGTGQLEDPSVTAASYGNARADQIAGRGLLSLLDLATAVGAHEVEVRPGESLDEAVEAAIIAARGETAPELARSYGEAARRPAHQPPKGGSAGGGISA